jgi:hypothetical protein
MMALSGVRSSCDMLARNSDLWRLAASSWALLSAIFPEEPGVLDRQSRLGGEGLQTSTTSCGNSPGAFRVKDRLPMI